MLVCYTDLLIHKEVNAFTFLKCDYISIRAVCTISFEIT
jgi:hypothetical protein